MGKVIICLIVVLTWVLDLLAQAGKNEETHTYQINKTAESITVDGDLSEVVWSTTNKVGEFWYAYPVDDKPAEAEYRTEVMMTYDDQFIYVAAICHGKGPFVISSLKRDNRQFWRGDLFAVSFDPVNERTNGVSFATNPAGVQHDMQFSSNTGNRDAIRTSSGFNVAWDNKWVTNSRKYTDRWVTEMAIPFKSLKYGGNKTWGINFTRSISSNNTLHAWAPIPRQLTTMDLGYTGALIWDQAPPKTKGNISVIPYILVSTFKDVEENKKRANNLEIGGDAKIAINSGLSLDLTLNPDFSQVDVDQQVTNLTTVNIRFPEKRLFFLENTDIFSQFGLPPMRPFFSRRIGLDEDGNALPIQFGARLSGNLNNDLRIGLMNLQTGSFDEEPGQNYTSFAFNQRVFGRTLIKGYFNNRQAYENKDFSAINYNRSIGGEIDFRSQNGALQANAGYGTSLSDGISNKNRTYHGMVSYTSTKVSFLAALMSLGDNYISDMGFMTDLFHFDAVTETSNRIGYTHSFTRFGYTMYPRHEKINNHKIEFQNLINYTSSGSDIFRGISTLTYTLNIANSSTIEIKPERNYAELFFPFAFTDFAPLPVGEYNWYSIDVAYSSDQRKSFYLKTLASVGDFYNGERYQFGFDLNYRIQPWGNFGLGFIQNELRFPEPYGSESLTLLGPKIEFSMSRDLFWTTFLQFNTQNDNFNINSRFQWQFRPLSNLFIVYTDNYAIEQFGPKNRGVVIKLNYWLNL